MKMDEALNDFLGYIASEKGLAKNSIAAYGRDGASLCQFLRTRHVEHFHEVKERDLLDFFLSRQEYASSSNVRCLIAIKVLFRFLKREGVIPTDIAFYLETPKLWQLIPDVLSLDEMESLLQKVGTGTETGARDLAMLEVLYGSGLRVSEVCTLQLQSIDESFIRVKGKGSKERLVPIGKKALAAVDHYLLHYRDKYDSEKENTLFVNGKGRPLSRITVWKMVKEYAKEAGLKKNISPHTFRHTFATHLLDKGADLRVIQEMLGHSNIGSTDRYTHVSGAHLQKAFQDFHPRLKP